MPFLSDTKHTKGKLPSTHDFIRANKLHQSLLEKKHARTGWSESKWANQFRLLRADLGGGAAKRITKVLEWFADNMNKEYCPLVRSAESFRQKFEQIEIVMKRDARDNPKVKYTKEARELAGQISRGYSWPKHCKDDIPLVVQLSWDNAAAFFNKLWKYKTRLKKKPYAKTIVEMGFIEKVQSHFAGGIAAFVSHWMHAVNMRILNWEGWSGKLLNWAFTEECKTFDNMGIGWSYEYSGSNWHWKQLKESLSNG